MKEAPKFIVFCWWVVGIFIGGGLIASAAMTLVTAFYIEGWIMLPVLLVSICFVAVLMDGLSSE